MTSSTGPRHLGGPVDGGLDEHGDEDAPTVRPYTVTGGRTAPASTDMPVEALVESLADASAAGTTEKRAIIELTAGQYLSIAELSAHLRLPVGVVRVLVGDLSDAGAVRVHGLTPSSAYNPATTLTVLESVLDGISAL